MTSLNLCTFHLLFNMIIFFAMEKIEHIFPVVARIRHFRLVAMAQSLFHLFSSFTQAFSAFWYQVGRKCWNSSGSRKTTGKRKSKLKFCFALSYKNGNDNCNSVVWSHGTTKNEYRISNFVLNVIEKQKRQTEIQSPFSMTRVKENTKTLRTKTVGSKVHPFLWSCLKVKHRPWVSEVTHSTKMNNIFK